MAVSEWHWRLETGFWDSGYARGIDEGHLSPGEPGGHACLGPWEAGRVPGPKHAGHSRQGAHRHLLVGLHAIQHHLDDLPAQLDALLRAVLGVGQVEEGSAACHLNVLVVLVALEGCDDQLCGDRAGAGAGSAARGRQGQPGL